MSLSPPPPPSGVHHWPPAGQRGGEDRRGIRGEMGGYSSTPRKGKVSEEGGDESLYYAATGMQVSPLVK